MNSELSKRIDKMLEDCKHLQSEYESDPFNATVVQAQGTLTSAEALIAEADKEPEGLAPEKIVEIRANGEKMKEIAEIVLRRANAQRDQFFSFLRTKIQEIREDSLTLLTEVREGFESKIEAAVKELGGGYFSEYEVGLTVPKAIARHRGKALRSHAMTLDRTRTFPDSMVELSHIIKALETAKQHVG